MAINISEKAVKKAKLLNKPLQVGDRVVIKEVKSNFNSKLIGAKCTVIGQEDLKSDVTCRGAEREFCDKSNTNMCTQVRLDKNIDHTYTPWICNIVIERIEE